MRAWTEGGFNAVKLGDAFGLDDLIIGSATISQNATNTTYTHGLSATPDFVLVSAIAGGSADRVVDATPGGTVITFSHADTDGATQTVYFLAGVLDS